MNALITLKTDEVGCRKPKCKHRLTAPHRHHRKCESLFIHAFGSLISLRDKPKYKKFKVRYEEFHPDDTVVICAWHHAEIHLIYDDIIRQDIHQRRRPLHAYSWKQAESLMKKLKKACLSWEEDITPGVNPNAVFNPRKKRR